MTYPTAYPVAPPWTAGRRGQAPVGAHPAHVHYPQPQRPITWPGVRHTGVPAVAPPAPRTLSAAAGNPTYIAALALLATVLIIGIPLACYLGLSAA